MRGLTLDEYLRAQRYSRSFVEGHLLPMAAAIWSSKAEDIRAYPLFAFVRFFESHGLLQLWERPNWRTVAGGSRAYVGALLQDFAGQLRLSTPVAKVARDAAGVTITARTGQVDHFDAILIATHADQALSMLEAPSKAERDLLGAFSYTTNTAVLHADATYMPRRRKVWSCWNYISTDHISSEDQLCVSYWMNRLQGIDPSLPLFVTLNPDREPRPEMVFGEYSYDHPQFGSDAMEVQARLGRIQGDNHTYFAGAWTGYGFHEDGLTSGIKAAEALGAVLPWRSTEARVPEMAAS